MARTEELTFICTERRETAGPNNNWMSTSEAKDRLGRIFDGCMRGRTMYVVPYIMGPAASPFSKVGFELTDSIYVALSMLIMTRAGDVALKQLGESADFVKGLHSKADLNPERRFICHFPEEMAIWSVGSGYGGNALLGKKCFALRIGSYMGFKEGWMAEHMLIVGVQAPSGETHYIAGAFPSACGKTNLAMLNPPAGMEGYKVWTVGDDIAWMHVGEDGRLWAVNPEAGYFGVVPGTSFKTNPNAMRTIQSNTIYTNVLETPDKGVWWEGVDVPPPDQGIDWQGRPWTPGNGEKGAHPNSRFTAPANQNPSISPEWENPQGVPISAFIFGGRRAKVAPLVYQSLDWNHGVYVGASLASETTAAAVGQVGVVRRDPMAMLPFCGYDMGNYFGHWLEMGKRIPHPPKIFNVNWFRTDENGKFLWPGFGHNLRVLKWIIGRCDGTAAAVESPIGLLPAEGSIDMTGLELKKGTMQELLKVDPADWKQEVESQGAFFAKFGDRLPAGITEQRKALLRRLERQAAEGLGPGAADRAGIAAGSSLT